jgi:hypothetical protein
LSKRSPKIFRENLIVDGPTGPGLWKGFMAEFQKKDFAAIDPGMMYIAGVTKEEPEQQRYFIQRTRGSSKTTDIAACVIWMIAFSQRKLDGVGCAEDKDQARLIPEQAEKILRYNPWLSEFIERQKNRLVNKITGSQFQILSRDTSSSFGLTPDFTICDEFTHWSQASFWTSIASSFAKREHAGGLLIVATNAGKGTDWKYDVAENAKASPMWYYSAPYGPPCWYRPEAIEEQRKLLPRHEFQRLWMNEWQTEVGDFVSLSEADNCIHPKLTQRDCTEEDGYIYVASIDYGEKNDRTVMTVMHANEDCTIIVDRMDVIDPQAQNTKSIPIKWVEEWMEMVVDRFGGRYGTVYFVIDPYQLLSVIQRYENRFNIHKFEFASGKGNFVLSSALRQLILARRVLWYEGCGNIYDSTGKIFKEEEGRNDLSTELSKLIVKQNTSGQWRIDHLNTEHDDRAFSLGAGCHFIVTNQGYEQFDVSDPLTDRHGLKSFIRK